MNTDCGGIGQLLHIGTTQAVHVQIPLVTVSGSSFGDDTEVMENASRGDPDSPNGDSMIPKPQSHVPTSPVIPAGLPGHPAPPTFAVGAQKLTFRPESRPKEALDSSDIPIARKSSSDEASSSPLRRKLKLQEEIDRRDASPASDCGNVVELKARVGKLQSEPAETKPERDGMPREEEKSGHEKMREITRLKKENAQLLDRVAVLERDNAELDAKIVKLEREKPEEKTEEEDECSSVESETESFDLSALRRLWNDSGIVKTEEFMGYSGDGRETGREKGRVTHLPVNLSGRDKEEAEEAVQLTVVVSRPNECFSVGPEVWCWVGFRSRIQFRGHEYWFVVYREHEGGPELFSLITVVPDDGGRHPTLSSVSFASLLSSWRLSVGFYYDTSDFELTGVALCQRADFVVPCLRATSICEEVVEWTATGELEYVLRYVVNGNVEISEEAAIRLITPGPPCSVTVFSWVSTVHRGYWKFEQV
jgi:hypothetical protein